MCILAIPLIVIHTFWGAVGAGRYSFVGKKYRVLVFPYSTVIIYGSALEVWGTPRCFGKFYEVVLYSAIQETVEVLSLSPISSIVNWVIRAMCV